MNLVQFKTGDGARKVATVSDDGRSLLALESVETTWALAMVAIENGRSIASLVDELVTDQSHSYDAAVAERRLLPPIDHADPAHMIVTGTGLSHLGSASARHEMHAKLKGDDEAALTDSMKMFKMGLEGGKPADGAVGVQPEWFYKGDGTWLAPPEGELVMPGFALDGGEEPEIAGVYIIGTDGAPYRVGFALGNEFSDHVTEKQNYLFLAHSKLRASALGPELLLGDLPADVRGMSRVRRGNEIIFEKEFLSGEANMSHSIGNLEHHHFKYAPFRRPGDVHIHYFGTATLSFVAGIETRPGDVFEIEAEPFGRALRNTLARAGDDADTPVAVKAL